VEIIDDSLAVKGRRGQGLNDALVSEQEIGIMKEMNWNQI
jgi:hypothetical protein